MAYKSKHTIRVDFTALEEPDIYALVQDPLWLRATDLTNESGEELSATELAKLLIVEWNIEDPRTGEVLPLPKDDETAVERMPLGIARHLGQRLQEAISAPLSASPTATS